MSAQLAPAPFPGRRRGPLRTALGPCTGVWCWSARLWCCVCTCWCRAACHARSSSSAPPLAGTRPAVLSAAAAKIGAARPSVLRPLIVGGRVRFARGATRARPAATTGPRPGKFSKRHRHQTWRANYPIFTRRFDCIVTLSWGKNGCASLLIGRRVSWLLGRPMNGCRPARPRPRAGGRGGRRRLGITSEPEPWCRTPVVSTVILRALAVPREI